MLGHLKIPFKLLLGLAKDRLPQLVKELSVSAVVCDFSPLRVPMGWVKDVGMEMDKLNVPLIQVRGLEIWPDDVTGLLYPDLLCLNTMGGRGVHFPLSTHLAYMYLH